MIIIKIKKAIHFSLNSGCIDMLLSLKKELLNPTPQPLELTITERLPESFTKPCTMTVTYSLNECDHYYLLKVEITGLVTSICQRCLAEFSYQFSSANTFAICDNEDKANKHLEDFESLVANDGYFDMETIVTDELHLYSQLKHLDVKECDQEVAQFIN